MDAKLEKVSEADPKELARIVTIIKGFGTAADLAKKIHVNPSTISRIVNGKLSGPISEDTLKKLAELISPDMEITKEQLFKANGYRVVEERISPHVQMRERTYLVRDILARNVSRRHGVWRVANDTRFLINNMFSAFFDLLVECDTAYDQRRPNNYLWGFDILMTPPHGGMSHIYGERDVNFELKRRIAVGERNFRDRISRYSLVYLQSGKDGIFASDELKALPARVSIVLDDEDLYKILKEKYEKLVLPMDASLILVDTEAENVKDEFAFTREDGEKTKVFLDWKEADRNDFSISEDEYDFTYDDMYDKFFPDDIKRSNGDKE